MARWLAFLLATPSVAIFACKFDPKIDANGFSCRTSSDCPTGYACVPVAGSSPVCCNSPDSGACFAPLGSGGALDAGSIDIAGGEIGAGGRGGSVGMDGAAGNSAQVDGASDTGADVPLVTTGGSFGFGGMQGRGGVGAGGVLGRGGSPATGGGTGSGGAQTDAPLGRDAQPDVACPPVCAIYCPYGNVLDGNGCPTCACNGPDSGATGGGPGTGGRTGTGGSMGTGGLGTGGSSPIGSGGIWTGTGGAGTGGAGTGGAGTGGAGTGGVGTGGAIGGSVGCSATTTPTPCDTEGSPCALVVDGTLRQFYVQLPGAYDAKHPYPVVFQFHPYGGNAEVGMTIYGIRSNFPNAVYVTPQGIPIGSTAGFPNTDGQDDAMTRAIMASIEATYCIDQSRYYAAGFSYGGAMSYTAACNMSDVFRAVGVMSGGPTSGAKCATQPPARPVAVWATHGVNDTTIAITTAQPIINALVASNGCSTTTQPVAPSPCVAYQGCSVGYPVVWCVRNSDGHTIPSFAAAAIANFFQQF